MTSRRVVDLVQRLHRGIKAGHAGTLDPLASGVLVVCVGAATRLIDHVQRMPKQYDGTFLLGRHSPTEDTDGEITELVAPPIPSLEQITLAVKRWVGPVEQRPPAFSALKIAGRRAYDLARRGEKVDLAPRTIVIHQIAVVAYEYPELRLLVECGSGTYIRSLGRDLAESLGTAAVMSRLVRTAIGGFRLENATTPEKLSGENWTQQLLPSLTAVEDLSRIELTPEEVRRIWMGQSIVRTGDVRTKGEVAAVDAAGHLVALLTPRGVDCWGPSKNFPVDS